MIDRYRRWPRWARWAIPVMVVIVIAGAAGSSSSKKATPTTPQTTSAASTTTPTVAKTQQAECEAKRTAKACGWPTKTSGPSSSLTPIGHAEAIRASSIACGQAYGHIQPLLERLRALSEEAQTQTEAQRVLVGPYQQAGRQLQTDASELETKIVNHADEPMVNKVSEGIASIAVGTIGVAVGLKSGDATEIKDSEGRILTAALALARVGERYGLKACVDAAIGKG